MTAQLPAQPPHRHARHRMSCRAFTLIEVLTVIGIIAALIAIVAIGFKVVSSNMKERSTRTALEVCKTLQSRYETINSLPRSMKTGSISATDLDAGLAVALAPTSQMAVLIRSVPDNRSDEDKMSGTSLEQLTWTPNTWAATTDYAKGDYVIYSSVWYVALKSIAGNAANANPSIDTSTWAVSATPASIPVPLDAWGHGMRFVPNTLTNLTRAGQTGQTVTNSGRPFWVSAGPDGLFATHDDNVYSFEN